MNGYVGRFAPSPTGPLHPGSVFVALGSWLLARQAGGTWRVRVEDVDRPREVPGAADLQLHTLRQLGLEPDGAVVRQSARNRLYREALDRLLASGDAFECHCSRTDVAAAGGVHRQCVPGRSRHDPSVRFRVPAGTSVAFVDGLRGPYEQRVDEAVGDFVLLRADGCWAYQLAVVVDDAAQQVTDVVRGADLLDSTPRQILLQRALGLATPRYLHLPLLVDAQGRKLSKSDHAAPASDAPLAALELAWRQLGQAGLPRFSTLREWLEKAVERFRREDLPVAETIRSQS